MALRWALRIGLNAAGTFERANYETSNAISHLRVLLPSNSRSKQVCELTAYIVAQFRARLAHDDVRRGRRNNTFCKQSVRSADCLRIFPLPFPRLPVRLIRRHLAIFRL